MNKFRRIHCLIAIISFVVFVACSSPSTKNNAANQTSSPTVQEVSNTDHMHSNKFNINTSLEPELKPVDEKLKVDGLYDKINQSRPYKSLDELVSKNVLTQEQFNQVKNMLTLDSSLTGEAKDVDYLVKLGLMKGHLLVAKELLEMKRPQEALPHIGHPIEELYVTVAEQFPQRGVTDFKSTLDEVKDFVQYKPQDPQLMTKFNLGMAAVDRAIAALPQTELKSSEFIPQAINGLLDSASAEYGGAINGNKIEEIDYQDSRGFVAYAKILFKSIEPQLQKDNSKLQQQLMSSLDDLGKVWPSTLPPAKPVASGEEVETKIKKIAEISKPLIGKASVANNSTNESLGNQGSIQPGLAKFNNIVTSTLTAAKAGDLTKAKQQWASASDTWQEVEEKVKAQSKEKYKTIEEKLTDVQATLEIPPNPDKDKSVAALESLSQTVDSTKKQLK